MTSRRTSAICPHAALFALVAIFSTHATAAPVEPVFSLAQKEKSALLDTLKQLVEIESGSRDTEGLDKMANVLAGRLKQLGGKVELIEADPKETYRMSDTPETLGKMVRATFTGTGTKKILMIAHMDTVYPRGMLTQQPFRLEADRALGLGIADDRHGIAVILHTLAILNAMNFRDYGTLTVSINGDEEIGSPGSRSVTARLGAEHDVVLSFENGGGPKLDRLVVETTGVTWATLTVRGRASHAASPQAGINALHELAHQIAQASDLSDKATNVRVSWTMATAGIVTNMIPPGAQAKADIRYERQSDYEAVEQKLRDLIKSKRIADSHVEIQFDRAFAPLEATDASRALAAHAQRIYTELGLKLGVGRSGGGTDAAFAATKTKAPVLEGFGLRGFGAHSTNAEYVLLGSIEPRLYLATRMIMDISRGEAQAPAAR